MTSPWEQSAPRVGIGASLSYVIAGSIVHHYGSNTGCLFLGAVVSAAFAILFFFMPETRDERSLNLNPAVDQSGQRQTFPHGPRNDCSRFYGFRTQQQERKSAASRPLPIVFQDHAVLETEPGFRIILGLENATAQTSLNQRSGNRQAGGGVEGGRMRAHWLREGLGRPVGTGLNSTGSSINLARKMCPLCGSSIGCPARCAMSRRLWKGWANPKLAFAA